MNQYRQSIDVMVWKKYCVFQFGDLIKISPMATVISSSLSFFPSSLLSSHPFSSLLLPFLLITHQILLGPNGCNQYSRSQGEKMTQTQILYFRKHRLTIVPCLDSLLLTLQLFHSRSLICVCIMIDCLRNDTVAFHTPLRFACPGHSLISPWCFSVFLQQPLPFNSIFCFLLGLNTCSLQLMELSVQHSGLGMSTLSAVDHSMCPKYRQDACQWKQLLHAYSYG